MNQAQMFDPPELLKLCEQYPHLVIKTNPHIRELEYFLYCTKCNEQLTIEQKSEECSDLRFDLSRGFSQGKPCISDGSESVRCGCGTEYDAIEEWEPY